LVSLKEALTGGSMIKNIRIVMFTILFLIAVFPLFGLECAGTNSISGKIYFHHPAPIYLYLVDNESSKTPLQGVRSICITPNKNDKEAGYVTFCFTNLPRGIYGIRCFQDLNDNKKLDRNIFGPIEPWGFSWNRTPPPIRPAFSKYCHKVEGSVNDINILLKEVLKE
jgi:hypothetical protein